jgi:uncharacterized protein (TIGR03083 family)
MAQWEYDRYHVELVTETERIAAVVRDSEPERPVPWCPEWTIADLAGHVGQAHRWAAVLVERRATRPVPKADVAGPVPDDVAEQAVWLVDSARCLSDAVRAAGPEAPVWTFVPGERTAGFWLRRMLHDTLVHRLDAEFAVGRAGPVAADLAADGVSDLLAVQATLSHVDSGVDVFTGLRGNGESLHFHATDDGLGEAGEWLVHRNPDGVAWVLGHGKADVAVRGRSVDLLLLLNRRAEPGACPVEIFGDEKLLDDWLANSQF